jgi:uncharacterized repeat protein (TIGR03803 family)
MQVNVRTSLPLRLALLAVGTLLAVAPAAAQVTDTVLNDFMGSNGSSVFAGLTFDTAGNLYGTTQSGGKGSGTVYELTLGLTGDWTETVLYEFGTKTKDGATPYSGVVFDPEGNLYGTTLLGGAHAKGTIYRLTPIQGGGWTETIIHSFGAGTDGAYPVATPVISGGNLYGTTIYGGNVTACPLSGKTSPCGTAYEVSAAGVYSVIHDFSNTNDGYFPVAGLTPDGNGNLYGQTTAGFTYGGGLLFELMPANGAWTERAIHPWGRINDGRPDGSICYGTLVFDAEGNMWGTSLLGGTHGGLGTLFRFFPQDGGFAETSVHGFGDSGDGASPYSGVVINSAGHVFGTTYKGGASGDGTVYEVIPLSDGFQYKLLYSFTGKTDGGLVASPLILDDLGNLYGTTQWGGDPTSCPKSPLGGCGVAFEMTGAQ